MSVAALMAPSRSKGISSSGKSLHQRNADKVTRPNGIAAINTLPIVKPHDMKTVFLSRTLFRVSSITDDVTRRQGHHHHHLRSVLLTLPIDGNHVLVVCGSNTSNTGGGSSVYVVRLNTGNLPTSVHSCLPIATISGCVQDYNVPRLQRREMSASALSTKAGEAVMETSDQAEEKIKKLLSPTSSLPGPSTMTVSTGDNDMNEEAGGGGGGGGVSCGGELSECALTCPKKTLHSFLFADAVTHAIWAVDVDMETLTAHVVPPSHYWWCRKDEGDKKVVASSGAERQQQQQREKMSKSKVLIGGMRGFLDGPFHTALFDSPSALCWRFDDIVSNANTEAPQKSNLRQGASYCSVLFVSDTGNHAIRYVNFRSRLVRTVSGIEGVPGYRDGNYRTSRLQEAAALVWCTSGLLFVDKPNGALRLITGLETAKLSSAEEREEGPTRGNDCPGIHPPSCVEGVKRGVNPRVWTVAGGLYANTGPYLDAKEAHQASLGEPSALALMPDGNGVLIADGRHQAIRLLSSRGVETFLGPYDYPSHLALPVGLRSCSHILVCRLEWSNAVSCIGLLVSSGVHQSVSLLVPRDEAGGASQDEYSELNLSSLLSVHPVECGQLASGILHKYTHREGEIASEKVAALNHIVRKRKGHSEGDGGKNQRKDSDITVAVPGMLSSSVTLDCVFSSRAHTTATAVKSGPLEKVMWELFKVYAHYACKGATSPILNDAQPSKRSLARLNLNVSYSLPLLSFWRFLAHTEYFAVCPLSSLPYSLSSFTAITELIFNSTSSEEGDRVLWSLQDWRVIAEIIHRLSVRQHGYHVISVMNFSFFCRVITFLYRWTRQREVEKKEGSTDKTHSLINMFISTVSEEELVEAYEDAVRRVGAFNAHLRSVKVTATVEKGEEMKNKHCEEEEEEGQFLAADEVLKVLVRNERSLRQLFDAYSKKIVIRRCSPCKEGNKQADGLWQLYRFFLSTDVCGKDMKINDVYAVTYTMFCKLFHTVDVFPKLISESLLQRAFIDALVTPLFHRLRRGASTMAQDCHQHDEDQHGSLFIFPISYNDKNKYACGKTALPFIPFIEAFTRVALTAFSLCTEHDREMYPTAAAKLEALMRWVNRSVEMGHIRQRSAAQPYSVYCGKWAQRTSAFVASLSLPSSSVMCAARVPAFFPSEFIPFEVSAQVVGRHCKQKRQGHCI